MLPDDVVATMAKVIFVISAAMIMCMAKVKAAEISNVQLVSMISLNSSIR